MNRKRIMALTYSVILGGCTAVDQKTRMDFSHFKQSPSVVSISPNSYLKLDKVWPLQGDGTYLQNVKTIIKGQEYTLSLHITLNGEALEFVAFNDIIGRLYHLMWTPSKMTWDASDHVPQGLFPENILADFLLVHLSISQLNEALEGAHISVNGNDRVIKDSSGIIRVISCTDKLDSLWQRVSIYNPQNDYRIHIQTVPAQ